MSGPIAVTGAAGNVGSAVMAALIECGEPVRALDRDPDRVRALVLRRPDDSEVALADVPTARLDLTDPGTFQPALAGAAGLFLVRPPAITRVGPTLNALVDRARILGVEHVVFSSVAGAEDNRIVPHHRVEQHLAHSFPSWTVLRPGFFAQNIATAYREDIVADDRLYLPAGDGLVAFVDTRDLGEVAAAVFGDPSAHRERGYTLTGPDAVDLWQVAAMLSDVTGRWIRYEPATIPRYLRHLLGRGLGLPQATVQTILHAGLRRGDAATLDPTLARLLGRSPTTLAAYLRQHASIWARGPLSPRKMVGG